MIGGMIGFLVVEDLFDLLLVRKLTDLLLEEKMLDRLIEMKLPSFSGDYLLTPGTNRPPTRHYRTAS